MFMVKYQLWLPELYREIQQGYWFYRLNIKFTVITHSSLSGIMLIYRFWSINICFMPL